MKLDLVGAKDIASRAGVQVDTVHKWRRRGLGFPDPLAVVSDSVPVWDYREVSKWLSSRGKDGAEQPNENP